MSSKFKIRAIKDAQVAYGWKIGDEFETFDSVLGDIAFIDKCGDVRLFETNKPYFELVTPCRHLPVKERVVKEIQAGTYGCVGIAKSSCGEWRYHVEPYMTVEQLRHAARVFNDLADALESKN